MAGKSPMMIKQKLDQKQVHFLMGLKCGIPLLLLKIINGMNNY